MLQSSQPGRPLKSTTVHTILAAAPALLHLESHAGQGSYHAVANIRDCYIYLFVQNNHSRSSCWSNVIDGADVGKETPQSPPKGSVAGAAERTGVLGDCRDVHPNIEKMSSSGFADVPDEIFFAAGCCNTCVCAASHVGPSSAGLSSKSSRGGFLLPGRRRRFGALSAESERLRIRNLRPGSAPKYGRRLTQSLFIAYCIAVT